MEKKPGSPALSVVPAPEAPAEEAVYSPAIVRLGLVLTIEGRSLPLELAFCTSEANNNCECFFVRPGARAATCQVCDSRHEVIGLIESVEERAFTLSADDDTRVGALPMIPPQTLIGAMFREMRRAAARKAATS